jgi:DeoR family glycerol-3-phosphate regulon repressor
MRLSDRRGIDEDGTILDYDYREVRVTRVILAQARTRVLACDHSKFSRRAPVKIGHVGDLEVIVTDQMPDQAFVDTCRSVDTELMLAEDAPI